MSTSVRITYKVRICCSPSGARSQPPKAALLLDAVRQFICSGCFNDDVGVGGIEDLL
jgi:hypothetical protein